MLKFYPHESKYKSTEAIQKHLKKTFKNTRLKLFIQLYLIKFAIRISPHIFIVMNKNFNL